MIAALDAPRRLHLNGYLLCAQTAAYPVYIVLILQAVEGASAVHQQAARLEGGPHGFHNFALAPPAEVHVMQAPFLHGLGILPEHAFA